MDKNEKAIWYKFTRTYNSCGCYLHRGNNSEETTFAFLKSRDADLIEALKYVAGIESIEKPRKEILAELLPYESLEESLKRTTNIGKITFKRSLPHYGYTPEHSYFLTKLGECLICPTCFDMRYTFPLSECSKRIDPNNPFCSKRCEDYYERNKKIFRLLPIF